MSSLTAEQKRRIEENRQRALAKRAEKLQTQGIRSDQSPRLPAGSNQSGKSLNGSNFGASSNSNPNHGKTFAGQSGYSHTNGASKTFQTGNYANTCSSSAPGKTSQSSTIFVNPNASLSTNTQYSNATSNFYKNNIPSNATSLSKTSALQQKSQHFQSNAPNTLNKQFFSKSSTSSFTKQVSGSTSFNRSTDNSSFNPQSNKISYNKPCTSQNLSPQKTFSKGSVKGTCLLISRERFEVDVGYCAPLIEVFKSMKTKQYDAGNKRWTFKLEDYQSLIMKIRSLNSVAEITPLPSAILQVFQPQCNGRYEARHISPADLSRLDNTVVNSLMPFQREGVDFAISRHGRVLLGDDMGLGKTIQAICIACYYRQEWPVLVVVPSSVRFQWATKFQEWVPDLDPQQINVVVTGKDSVTSGLVNIISYDMMTKKKNQLVAKNFKVVILDESHSLKNFKTARTQASQPIVKSAKRVLLLSGTPALSRPAELYTQIWAVNPRLFPKFHEFGLRYCDGKQSTFGWDYSGSSHLAELQILLEESIMIRRLKSQVISQLPSKSREMVVLDPQSIHIDKSLKNATKVLESNKLKGMDRHGYLLQYFHETGTAKIKAVRDYICDMLESGRKFLVFAHHQEVLDGIEETVKKKDYSYIRIDGRTNPEQRNFYCKKFQEKENVLVAILSISAANSGLNLTSASLVVFAELFWNPGILVQAEDRVHRIGQENSVNIQYLVAKGTADDYIWPMVQRKLDVLSKAGLTKDDFKQANTTNVKDPHQKDIMAYFESSFFEEDDEEGGCSATGTASLECGVTTPTKGNSSAKASSILNYMTKVKPKCESRTDDCTEGLDLEWFDDLDEDGWSTGPAEKKQKLYP